MVFYAVCTSITNPGVPSTRVANLISAFLISSVIDANFRWIASFHEWIKYGTNFLVIVLQTAYYESYSCLRLITISLVSRNKSLRVHAYIYIPIISHPLDSPIIISVHLTHIIATSLLPIVEQWSICPLLVWNKLTGMLSIMVFVVGIEFGN